MRKIATIILIMMCILLMFTGCASTQNADTDTYLEPTNNTFETSPSGYISSPGMPCEITGYLTYEVIEYNGEYLSVIDEAEELVKKWWNDNSTFHRPKIVWVRIIEGDFRGFQDFGYLFLDPNTTREDLLATAVHEWLHELVPKSTLIDLERDGWGRAVMEMVVEAITVDILGEENVEPTGNYLYFKNRPELWKHREALKRAFREAQDYSVYEKILGTNSEEIIYMAEMQI
ncbi:MAG: hypothetical protein ACI4UE_05030 [Candidatus Scatovivens sp.]